MVAALAFRLLAGDSEIPLLHGVLRDTARVSVVFFGLAFTASSFHVLFRKPFSRYLLRERRYLGLAFAASHGIHLLALILLAFVYRDAEIVDRSFGDLAVGSAIFVFIGLLALTSNDWAQAKLGRGNWRRLHWFGSYVIWVAFASSYIPRGFAEPAYLPAAFWTVGLVVLRVIAGRWQRMSLSSPS